MRVSAKYEERESVPASNRLVDQGAYTVPIADHDLLTRELA